MWDDRGFQAVWRLYLLSVHATEKGSTPETSAYTTEGLLHREGRGGEPGGLIPNSSSVSGRNTKLATINYSAVHSNICLIEIWCGARICLETNSSNLIFIKDVSVNFSGQNG